VQKLASSIVQQGALPVEDAVGWVARLAATLELIQVHGRAHGRVSAKALQILARNCDSGGFFLDTADLADDVAYHSPDRIAGARASPEDDTWALGVLLYFALTGELPFAGMSSESVGAEMLAAEVEPLARFGIKDPRLQQIIDAVFSWDPNVRLHTARSVRAKLCEACPFVAELPPLKLGKPDIALFDEEDQSEDDEGQKLTAVVYDASFLQARMERVEARAAAKSAAAPEQPSIFDSLTGEEPVEEEPEGGIVDGRLIGDFPLTPYSGLAEQGAAAAAPKARRRDAEPSAPGFAAEPAGAAGWAAEAPRPAAMPSPASPREALMAPAVAEPRPEDRRALVHPLPGAAPAAPRVAAPMGARPSNGSRARAWDVLLGALFLAVGALGAYLLFGPEPPPRTSTSASAVPTAPPSASAARAASGQSAATGSAPASSGSVATGASAAPSAEKRAGDLGSCMLALFPSGTFAAGSTERFDHVCKEADACKGGHALRTQVVRAGSSSSGATAGMNEWSLLGWYEMPAFVVARAMCCKDPPRLSTAFVPKACRLDRALEAVGKAATGSDPKALENALRGYRDVVICLLRAGVDVAFGQKAAPAPGAAAAFDGFLKRARKAHGL